MYANFYYILHNYQSPQYCLCALTLMIVYIYLRETFKPSVFYTALTIYILLSIQNSYYFLGYLFKYLTYRLKNKQVMRLSIS